VIWCPKYRRSVLTGPVESRLKAIVREVAGEFMAEVLEMEVMPDHVHLLVEAAPQLSVSQLVARMKGRSSRLLRAEFPSLAMLPALWTPSMFVSTVGGAPLAVVKRCIERQKVA